MNKEEIMNQNKIEISRTDQDHSQKEILNVYEASLYLRIAKSTLYKLTSARKITHYCPHGKLLYFRKSDLDQFLLKNKQETIEESGNKAMKFINLNQFKTKNLKK